VIAMTTQNPALIRLVTGRYRDLQGLATVADAAFLLLFAGVGYLARSGWIDRTPAMVLVIAVGGAYLWARFTVIRRRIDAYYASRYGRVQWSLGRPFLFPMYLQGTVSTQMLLDMGIPLPARVAIVLLVLGGLPGWIVVRDWPYRAHWLLPVAAGIVVAAMFSGVTTHEQAKDWLLPALLACGASLAFAGLLDHLLLMRTLHPGPSDQPERAPVQTP
jgi:hypothetical protein